MIKEKEEISKLKKLIQQCQKKWEEDETFRLPQVVETAYEVGRLDKITPKECGSKIREDLVKQLLKELPEEYRDGRRKGESGTVINASYCEGYNTYRKEVLEILNKLLK